jgi:hypothetical protein
MSDLAHVHKSGEDLLAALLDPTALDPRELAALRGCEVCNAQRLELERVLDGLRTALERSSVPALAPRELARFRDRVLSRTTREDLTRLGDARLVIQYIKVELHSSRALRLAAASLVLHVIALAVLLAILFRDRAAPAARPVDAEPSLARQASLPAAPPSAPPTGAVTPSAAAPAEAFAESRLRIARRALIAAGVPPSDPFAGESDALSRLLAARSERIRLGAWVHLVGEPSPSAPLLQRALWAELLLDDAALSGRADPRLARAFEGLELLARGASPAAQLASHALERASACGLRGEASDASSIELARAPFDRRWFELLALATADAPRSRTLERWLEWGERAR